MENYWLGIDIGGSHISAGLIKDNRILIENSFCKWPIQADTTKAAFTHSLKSVVKQALKNAGPEVSVSGVGIAVPGPFMYHKGIAALMPSHGKLHNLFGLHIPSLLHTLFPGKMPLIETFNDAVCFGKGIKDIKEVNNYNNILALTLGTGLGSVFMLDGEIVTQHPAIPLDGHLYNQPFLQGIADDYFSTGGILDRFHQQYPTKVPHALAVSILAALGNVEAIRAFEDFGIELAEFLSPYICNLSLQCLVLGGNISQSAKWFVPSMQQWFARQHIDIEIVPLPSSAETMIMGAVSMAMENQEKKQRGKAYQRITFQPVAPWIKPETALPGYELHPSIGMGKGKISAGVSTLIPLLVKGRQLVIDGFSGVDWQRIIQDFNEAFETHGIYPLWISMEAALKEEAVLDEMLAGSLGDAEGIFGKRYEGVLADFFDDERLRLLKQDDECYSILYGIGASLANWDAPLLYAELPKNELQFIMRSGAIANLGCRWPSDAKQMYKRYYFVEWPALNKHKAKIWPGIDYLLDVQYADTIHWVTGADWRNALQTLTTQSFRVKPWFEPGVWGGQWMKNNLPGLDPAAPNYAWSFELITPENGITLESDNLLLECSFDFLMYMHAPEILGDAFSKFNVEFPIRFDFLDTFQGGNLSIQCHPSGPYIAKHFGENFTQDETYYILDCDDKATVYLGFQKGIIPAKFEQKLKDSFTFNQPLDIEEDVQHIQVKKHDLFLIPNQTVHGAGAGNLVLEISSTPYIFTFKLYDWLRPDMDGKPRPINIEHGMQNLDFGRSGKKVKDTLISKPVLLEQDKLWKRYALPTHPEHFYTIERYEFTGSITIAGNQQCHVLMLVSGTQIRVLTSCTQPKVYHYAETFILPASAGTYIVTNDEPNTAMLIIAFVKPSFCRQ
jgi:predicted NBD/HSP70 family sugar kinase/mannose-6-phosphate isomerase class I